MTQIKITYLFNQPGQAVIPEITIPWFDITNKKSTTATLPAQTLHITGTKPNIRTQQVIPKPKLTSTTKLPKHQVITTNQAKTHIFWWLNIGLFISLILIGLIYALYRWLIINHTSKNRQLLKRLRTACLKNQPLAAQQAFLAWAQQQWPDYATLNIKLQDPLLAQLLADLNHAIYAADSNTRWQGQTLWQWVKTYISHKKTHIQKHPKLPPLNLQ